MQLRVGEGVNALRFQWQTSKSCARFVDALALQLARDRAAEWSAADANAGGELVYDYTSFNLDIDDADKSPERAPNAFLDRELDSLGLNTNNASSKYARLLFKVLTVRIFQYLQLNAKYKRQHAKIAATICYFVRNFAVANKKQRRWRQHLRTTLSFCL